MDFSFSQKEEALRLEVREFIKAELPPGGLPIEEAAHTAEKWAALIEFIKKVAAKGWLTMTWPAEYGGSGATAIEQLVFAEEMAYHRAPPMTVGSAWVGPAIAVFGTEEQKKSYLPKIAACEISIALGYSEPNAGSDLASLQTTATEESDCYVINGQKIWTSTAHRVDYIWLAARTDPDASKRHKGISVFLVDTKTAGITCRPFEDMRGLLGFNEVYFDAARVPKSCLIGEKNRGWEVILTALNLERVMFGGGATVVALCKRYLNMLVDYVRKTEVNGRKLSKDPVIRQSLAKIATELEVSRLLAYRLAHIQNKGMVPTYEASIAKVFGSEMEMRLANAAMEILGLRSQLKQDSKWTLLEGEFESLYLWCVAEAIGAGTNEIQRNLIARIGLGLT